MFQDIAPYQFKNEFTNRKPAETDYVIIANNDQFLLECQLGVPTIPTYASVNRFFPQIADDIIYLFSIDDKAFFLSMHEASEAGSFRYYGIDIFRCLEPSWTAFAGATAAHLALWYSTHQYCGRCMAPMKQGASERILRCEVCGLIEYPQISPVVIVGVIDGERILMTKYANAGYKKYALVAGFMEIGETLEDTIRREVMEEVGLHVRNIRYYKSQPWAFSQSVLVGFFADLDGDKNFTLDKSELSEASWFARDEIPRDDSTLSLTWDMIEAFRMHDI